MGRPPLLQHARRRPEGYAMNRRFFLLAAPAIVAAPSLMRVSAAALDSFGSLSSRINEMLWGDGAKPWGIETVVQINNMGVLPIYLNGRRVEAGEIQAGQNHYVKWHNGGWLIVS